MNKYRKLHILSSKFALGYTFVILTFDAELIYGYMYFFFKLDEKHMHTEVLGALQL